MVFGLFGGGVGGGWCRVWFVKVKGRFRAGLVWVWRWCTGG